MGLFDLTMPDNSKNQSNASTISSTNTQETEGVSRMKIEKKVEESKGYPDRPGEANCRFYLRTGSCGYGTDCRFNHPPLPPVKTAQDKSELPQREGQPDCGYYLKTGTCKYGSSCKYHHPLDRRGAGPVTFNTLGLPIRQEEKPCPFYMRTYTCKFGPACKFDHPQPTSLETALPVPGPAAMGTMGSNVPSTGIPYFGTIPAWPLPSSYNVASSRVPGSQSYMPVVFPPLQSPFPAHSWNTYMGNLNSFSASDKMVQNFVNDSKGQGEQVTGGPVDLSKPGISNLPERPDQPECKFFMSTGSCKYGSNCKFHHPKERVAHTLGPHGLPCRPGEDVCGHFCSYGVCKYGSTCKFDHPVYVASYFIGMPSVPFFPSERNMVTTNSTETSDSKSIKITDWIQKPEPISDKDRQNSVKKSVEDHCETVHDDHPNAASAAAATPTTSELPRDQSD